MHNISYDYARAEMYSHEARLREAQLNGMAYLKREGKPASWRRWFTRHWGKPAASRYIPAARAR